MKKIILMLAVSLLSLSGYCQLNLEGFETNPWPANGPGPGWGIYQNNFGTIETWRQSDGTTNEPAKNGVYAAFVNNQNVPSPNKAQDWLVTPSFPLPANPQLRFWSRLAFNGDNGGIYKILIAPATANLADLASYTTVITWTEPELNPQQQVYTEKLVDLPTNLPAGPVVVAFLMEADNADRWLIDDVQVVAKCLDPTNLSVNNITEVSAELSWDNPSGATDWEIEVLLQNGSQTGAGETYNGSLPYLVEDLTLGTQYKFYVRALCTGTNKSAWAGPYSFRTVTPGSNCSAPLNITSPLPYNTTDNTSNYGDDYTGSPGTSCGLGPFDEYLNGNEVVYAYTPAQNIVVDIDVTGVTAPYAGVFVYTSCANIGTECFAADYSQDIPEDLSTGQINLSAGQTYYIVITTSGSPMVTPYTLDIKEVTCPYPSSLQVSGITTTGANISWVEYGNATAWQYVLQAPGTGEPTGAGTSISTTTYSPTLTVSTGYEFYVRADCGSGVFSDWVGPLTFNTQCDPVNVPFSEGFNSDSPTQNCWSTINVAGAATWDLNTTNAFEGDEAAGLDPMFDFGNTDYLISPAINLTANQRLRFHHQVSGFWGSSTNFKVMMSTTGIDPEDFTTEIEAQQMYNAGGYEEHEIYLNAIPPGTVYFAWIVEDGGSGALYIDNVIIDPIPPCPEPTDLTAGDFTTTTAELSWEAGFNENSWEVVVQAPGLGEPTAAGEPATNPFTADELNPNTVYEYYVRATCGATDGNSIWSGPFEFRTACEAFDVPFYEGFNSDSTTEACWKITDVNGGGDGWIMNNTMDMYEGDESARFNAEFSSSNDDWLISPAINLTGNQRLSYQYRVYSYSYPVPMEVRISTTGTDPEDFTTVLLPVANYNNTYYIKQVIDLTAYTGPVHIAWHGPGGSDSGMYLYVDDVKIEDIAPCADPYNLVVSNLTTNSAQLSWTPGNDETQWEVIAVPSNSGLPTEEGIITSDNPYILNDLLSGTTYDFYIRSVCTGGQNSSWAGPARFTTVITNDECANAITLPVNPGVECIEYRSGSVIGATQSSETSICDEVPYDDVWFEFTATSTTHNITLSNIQGSAFTVRWALYEGDECGSLTHVICNPYNQSMNIEDLVIGQKYKVRVYTGNVLQTNTFDICVRTVLPPVSTDNTTYTVEQLVTDVLVGSECAQVSNVTWSTGTNFTNDEGVQGPNGIAYFNQNGSAFPMAGGIVLTTGNAMRTPGPEDQLLGDGDTSWPGDADLNQIVLDETGQEMNSTNATTLEFDFIPLIDNMSFDFLFASEEYGQFQCDFSDSFAFLLTDSNGVTTNLALVPGTTSPVSVVTIRDDQFNDQCESVNPEYFGKYNTGSESPLSATAFQGQTKILTAHATVVPNTTYHIKMVIADRGGLYDDTRYDSAVFLAAGSFNIGDATLGDDLLVENGTAICESETHTIQSGMSSDVFTFKWYRNDELLPGETNPTLVVTTPGTYKLEAEVIGADCAATDSVTIEFYPPVEDALQTPIDLVMCSDTDTANFDLTQNTAVMLGVLNPDDFTITYHISAQDAELAEEPLDSPYENLNNPQPIYARIVNNETGCYGILDFDLKVNPAPQYDITDDFGLCHGGSDVIEVTGINFNVNDATYIWKRNGETLTEETTHSLTVTLPGTYEVTITLEGCVMIEEVIVSDIPAPVADTLPNVSDCNSFILPQLNAGNNYYTGTGGTGNLLTAGTAVESTQIIYIFVQSGICSDESSFSVTIIPAPAIELAGSCVENNYTLEATFLDSNYTADNVVFEWKNPEGTVIGGNEPTVIAQGEGTYQVTVTPIGFDANCPIVETIVIKDITCRIQKGISPNNDGMNDNFDLTGMNVTKLSIFNRYGREVYSKTNYVDEWHGQTDGDNELPTGTYYYMIESGNGDSKTGWIYINREEN